MNKLSSYFHGLWQAMDAFRLAATYQLMNNLHTIGAIFVSLVLLFIAFVFLIVTELI